MRYTILFLLLLLVGLWFANREGRVVEKTELNHLSVEEIAEHIAKPDYTKTYFSRQTVVLKINRTWIPLVSRKDTLQASNISYYSTD